MTVRSSLRGSSVRAALLASAAMLLAGCNDESLLPRNSRHYVPISAETQALMSDKSMRTHAPILIRAYKQESELEVWKQNKDGQFALLKTYPMCRWSGQLGPKVKEGDRQVPEGFYNITPAQLNPNSNFYLSFNVGYPNNFDRAFGRTGSHIMVHGACSSMGCFSMTDSQIADIYALTREAFAGGQKSVQLQSFPFRMTPQNFAKFRADPNIAFWKNLKEGHDHFEVTKQEVQVAACNRRYVFNQMPTQPGARFDANGACPAAEVDERIATAVAERRRNDEVKVAELVQQGTRALKRLYHDGDQHPSFRRTMMAYQADSENPIGRQVTASRVNDVSRPDALARGPVEIPVEEYASARARGKTPMQIAELAFDRQLSGGVSAPAVASATPGRELAAAPSASTPAISLPNAGARTATPAAVPAASPVSPALASANPVASVPSTALPANAAALAPAMPSPASETRSVYDRVLGGLGLRVGNEQAKAEEPPLVANSEPARANVPTPPPRPVR
jgi:murein L,D-transpeptidase YafK